jgi:WD40 repeat protein
VATFWSRIPLREAGFRYSAASIAPAAEAALLEEWAALAPRRVLLAGPQEKLVVACQDGSLYLMERTSPNPRRTLIGRHPDGEPETMLCTPDASVLISMGSQFLCAWDVPNACLLWPAAARLVLCIAVHPRHAELLCGRSDGCLERRDAYSGRLLQELAIPEGPATSLAVFPDGEHVVSIGPRNQLTHWQLSTGRRLWTASLRSATHRSLSVSQDGRWLAIGALAEGSGWKIICFDTATGQRRELGPPHTRPIHGTLFAPGGRLFSWGADGRVRLCDIDTFSEVAQWSPGTVMTRP